MSRLSRTIKYGTITGTSLSTVFFMVSAGMHIAGPDDIALSQRNSSDKIGTGVPSWSLVGMLTGAGFAIGAVLGGIYGACSYDAPYQPPVFGEPLIGGQHDNIAAAIVNIQPEGQATHEARAANSGIHARVSPLGRLNFLAQPVTPPVVESVQVVVQRDSHIETPTCR